MKLAGWGRYPVIEANISAPRSVDDIIRQIKKGTSIARGNGRSYGDSSVSSSNTLHMKHFNRMLAFNEKSGQLVAEAGLLLADIIDVFLPEGWFPSVTPGTKFVTLGGMIAADVHGKNHHKDGSFGQYIDWIDIIKTEGKIERCSKIKNPELFHRTIGGMGLTGIIIRAAIRLKRVPSAWIKQRTLTTENIEQTIDLFEQSLDSTYSVAWIDCLQKGKKLGRSLIMLGEHAQLEDLPDTLAKSPYTSPVKQNITIPFSLPAYLLNSLTVKTFNKFYYWNSKRKDQYQLVDWDRYFYPLDAILGWNKIYGRRGFVQFQCVIPLDKAKDGLSELLQTISVANVGSFLSVLKRFGEQESLFSFPMKGYTLALDFPVNPKTLTLMQQLDLITLKHAGRFYLAKDSRMSRDTFLSSDPRAKTYKSFRVDGGLNYSFSSAQSERLGL